MEGKGETLEGLLGCNLAKATLIKQTNLYFFYGD